MRKILQTNKKTILFCLGCLSALAMAPVYAWPLMMVGYSTLLYTLIQTTCWKKAGIYTFVFFFGYFFTSLYWVSSSLFVDLERWWWALPFSFMGLPFLLALFPAFIIGTLSFLTRSIEVSKLLKSVFVIFALILADITRGHLFTGFPWSLPTHTWTHTPFIMTVLLPSIGLWGLNALTILLFCIPAFLRKYQACLYVILFASLTLIPFTKQETSSSLPDNIVMVQANIPQDEKWDPRFVGRNLDRYINMSLEEVKNDQPHIIIWPETALSDYVLDVPHFQQRFLHFLDQLPPQSVLISGVLIAGNDQKHHNSIVVFNRNGDHSARYDKHHLVPFGEYMPFGLDTITGFSNFSKGEKPTPLTIPSWPVKFLPLICYESIFPHYAQTNEPVDFLLILTNDAWFGKTAGPHQHFDHAVFRAHENSTPVLRLSGTGISAFIDSNENPHKTKFFEEANIVQE